MITFFRKMRKGLLKQKNIFKYLTYAVGEIILVVIGILIALEFNNANEAKKNKLAIDQLLHEIQVDLLTGMQEIKDAISYYESWDESCSMILSDTLTEEDYLSNLGSRLSSTGTFEYPLFLKDDTYKLLLAFKDKIPSELDPIMKELDFTLIGSKEQVEYSQRLVNDLLKDFRSYRFKQQRYIEMDKGILNDEIIDFYLNDKTYPKYIYDYQRLLNRQLNNATQQFDKMATSYLLIQNQLDKDETLPLAFVSNPRFSRKELKEYSGTYELDNSEIQYTLFEYEGFLMIKGWLARNVYGEYNLMSKIGKDSLVCYSSPEELWVIGRNEVQEVVRLINIDNGIRTILNKSGQ